MLCLMMIKMNCKNCDEVVNGNFCTHCGQSTKVDKVNLPNFLRELSDSVFQINKGFFYTLKALFIRPGHSIREYLNGKRKNHFKPIAYALTLSTIYFLLSQFTGSKTFLNDAITGWSEGMSDSKIETSELATFNWFAKNYAYTVLMLLPLYALASYLSFIEAGFNYLEHCVLNAYITGQQAIFYSLSSILSLITEGNDFLASIGIWLSIFYTFFVFGQFFSEQSRMAVGLRLLLTYALYLIMLLLIIFIIFIASQ